MRMDFFETYTQFGHASPKRFDHFVLIPSAGFLTPTGAESLLPDRRSKHNSFSRGAQVALANDVIHLRRSNRRCSWGAYSDYLLDLLQQFEWLNLNDFLLAKTIAKPSAFRLRLGWLVIFIYCTNRTLFDNQSKEPPQQPQYWSSPLYILATSQRQRTENCDVPPSKLATPKSYIFA